jgi:hypothetical protein
MKLGTCVFTCLVALTAAKPILPIPHPLLPGAAIKARDADAGVYRNNNALPHSFAGTIPPRGLFDNTDIHPDGFAKVIIRGDFDNDVNAKGFVEGLLRGGVTPVASPAPTGRPRLPCVLKFRKDC